MLVKYKVKNEKCLTKCVANHSPKIGSNNCCECKHYNGSCVIKNESYIDCKWIESVLKKISNNHPELYMEYVTNEMLAKL